jgi:hypothetical protein
MLTRILLQVGLFLLPFLIFWLYRLAARDLEKTGKAWPLTALVIAGSVLSFGWFVASAWWSSQAGATCYVPSRYVNGELRPAQYVPKLADGTCPAEAQRRSIGAVTRGPAAPQ